MFFGNLSAVRGAGCAGTGRNARQDVVCIPWLMFRLDFERGAQYGMNAVQIM